MRLILPDIAMVEMTKSEEWESTLRASLRLLAEEPELVVPSRGVGELVRLEMETGSSAASQLVAPELVDALRGLLQELASREDGQYVSYLRAATDAAKKTAAIQYLDHNRNKARALRAHRTIKDVLFSDRKILNILAKQHNNGDRTVIREAIARGLSGRRSWHRN